MNEEQNIQQRESIKLTRSVTGKVGWEIKIFIDPSDEHTQLRLEKINKELEKKFGKNGG